jgi:hypothetical protein
MQPVAPNDEKSFAAPDDFYSLQPPILGGQLLYQFLAAEIRALHSSYGVGDGESYKRALTFLENCERYTLRSLVRRSAKHHAEVTVDHAKRVFSRALKKLDTSQGHNPTLRYKATNTTLALNR